MNRKWDLSKVFGRKKELHVRGSGNYHSHHMHTTRMHGKARMQSLLNAINICEIRICEVKCASFAILAPLHIEVCMQLSA